MPEAKGQSWDEVFSETRKQTLAEALVEIQRKLDKVPKHGSNPHFGNSFIKYDDLVDEIIPKALAEDVFISQPPSHIDGKPALTTILWHAPSGERLEYTMPLILQKQDMQGLGGAITYGKRQMLAAIFGIAEMTDDDGNQASRPPDRRVDPETPVPKTFAEVEALWTANDLDVVWLEQASEVKRSVQMLARACVLLLAQEPAEPFGYSRQQIQGVFAGLLDGVILEGPPAVSQEELDRMTAKVLGRVEGEEDIPFGEPA